MRGRLIPLRLNELLDCAINFSKLHSARFSIIHHTRKVLSYSWMMVAAAP